MAKTVLIVDDEPINRILYEEFLRSTGYNVVQAENGSEGLKLAQEVNPDFIILDWRLPEIDGESLYLKIRAIDKLKDVPMIIVSADYNVYNIKETIPAQDIYLKPISHREIKERIDMEVAKV